MTSAVHDLIGIGIGPFNLGLACLTEPLDSLDALFLDQSEGFDWHPGLLMESSHLQTPFLADLVTLADPTSHYSFLNYAKVTGQLYPFYIRENFFLPRIQYNQYCRWVTGQLSNLRFGRQVFRISHDPVRRLYRVDTRGTRTGTRESYLTRKLVLGVGARPHIPECCPGDDERVIHASAYLPRKAQLQRKHSITVVGGGQSAAEVFQDLLADIDHYDYRLNWITRSPRFMPLEYTKLTLEMTSPDYIDYFHALTPRQREQRLAEQQGLYKGIDSALINAIYDQLYEKSLTRRLPVFLTTQAELTRVDPLGSALRAHFHQREKDYAFPVDTDALVLATGYQPRVPDFLDGIRERIAWTPEGRYAVGRDYAIDHAGAEIFVQNGELYTHGFTAPDLGMGCYLNACIINALTGQAHYPVEARIAFQDFQPAGDARAASHRHGQQSAS